MREEVLDVCTYLWLMYVYTWASLLAQIVKNLPEVQETWLQSLCQEYPLK